MLFSFDTSVCCWLFNAVDGAVAVDTTPTVDHDAASVDGTVDGAPVMMGVEHAG